MEMDHNHEAPGLVIIWTSADPEVARSMAFMYARNSRLKGWWEEVRLVIWGPSARLLAEDLELQGELPALREAGVQLLACRACADMFGVAGKLAELGFEVLYMGVPLTTMLKSGWRCLTV